MSWDTTWSALGSPRPRAEPIACSLHTWPTHELISLPPAEALSPVLATFAARRSRRKFGPLTQQSLATLLAVVGRCQECIESPLGFALERRGVPSGGAIHPIHLLVCDPATRHLHRYDGLHHTLCSMGALAQPELLSACSDVLDLQQGTLIFFVAEPGKTSAKYEEPVSIVWRDAGVLQGSIALVAEALGLNFCLLGITGDPWLAVLSQEGKLRGVGAALVGSRP